MALTAVVSQAELGRVASLCYEARPVRVSLANLGAEGYTADDLVADWDTIKIVGNGYVDFRATVGVGSYTLADSRYEMPSFVASYTATDAGFTFNSIYIVMGTYGEDVAVTDAEVTSNTATITTSAAHGYVIGDVVNVTGMTDTDYNGFVTVTDVPTITTFEYYLGTANKASSAETGTANKVVEELYTHSVLNEAPSISLATGQTQKYRIRLCTDD
jgi:hypothetical protein